MATMRQVVLSHPPQTAPAMKTMLETSAQRRDWLKGVRWGLLLWDGLWDVGFGLWVLGQYLGRGGITVCLVWDGMPRNLRWIGTDWWQGAESDIAIGNENGSATR